VPRETCARTRERDPARSKFFFAETVPSARAKANSDRKRANQRRVIRACAHRATSRKALRVDPRPSHATILEMRNQ
jgi:hypothetical protein